MVLFYCFAAFSALEFIWQIIVLDVLFCYNTLRSKYIEAKLKDVHNEKDVYDICRIGYDEPGRMQ